MSRSNPHDNAPNPAVRWFEWNGEHGTVRYYDKDAKLNVDVPLPFTFILLDELGSVRGWHDLSESGIYSNEVRDTRSDVLIVKAFKGGTLIEGVYRDIKDKVNSLGGQFNANCYVAFKDAASDLAIGSIRFKGAALGSWMEFRKAHRRDLFTKAVTVTGFTEGKKGKVVFRMPTFQVSEMSGASNLVAMDLDKELQAFLRVYLNRRTVEQAVPDRDDPVPTGDDNGHSAPLTEDDIPFMWLLPILLPLTAAGLLFA